MKKPEGYYQFPLCILNMPCQGGRELASHIIGYTLVSKGRILGRDGGGLDDDRLEECLSEDIIDDDSEIADAIRFFIARTRVDLRIQGLSLIEELYDAVNYHRQCFERQHGRDAEVRVREDYVLDLLHRRISEREFRIYTAIKAAVGRDAFKAVGIERIRYAAVGFKSGEAFKKSGGDPSILLTKDKIRYTRMKLEERGCFCSFRLGRPRWFSFSLSVEELSERIVERKKKGIARLARRQSLERQAAADIRVERARYSRSVRANIPAYNRTIPNTTFTDRTLSDRNRENRILRIGKDGIIHHQDSDHDP